MQPLTFTPKLLRQRRFFSFLLPLFALFVGLGSVQSVTAQTITTSNYFIKNTSSSTNTTFGGANSTATPNYQGAFLGSFDINNPNGLLFNGGEIVFTAPSTPSSVLLEFQLFTPSGAGAAATPVGSLQTISLTLVTGPTGGGAGTYRYSLSNAGRSLISLAGQAGTYDVDATFRVNGGTRGFTPFADMTRTANFTVTGTAIPATSIGNSNIFINQTGELAPNITYSGSSATTPKFQGANLGTYDINNGQLTLNGGNVTTFERTGEDIRNVRLVYQLEKPAQPAVGTTPATPTTITFAPSTIALSQLGNPTTVTNGTSRVFSNATELRNLITSLAATGSGVYNITVSFAADLFVNNSYVGVITDPNMGGYTASFTTTGVPFPTDTWIGLTSDDWFNPANWSLGVVPDINTNVVVPNYNNGSANIAPNIRATTTPAMARNVDLQGSSQAQRSILRLVTGRFIVSGSFLNQYDSFIQRTDAGTIGSQVIEFSSPTNAQITSGNFTSVEISGGGKKAVTGTMNVDVRLTFLPNGGIISTDISKPLTNEIRLSGRSTAAPNGAQVQNETETAYVRGFMETSRVNVGRNELTDPTQPFDPVTNPIRPRTYGNMGMSINFKGTNDPGDVRVTRNTAESYTPLSGPNGTARYGIRRIFGVRPSSPLASTGGLLADLTFRYLDSELLNLGPDGTGTIQEPNLALFVSTSGGNQFGLLGRDGLDQVNNVLTKNDVRTFATFTLGDITAPLPVSLIAFDAKRIGADALITWQTASEKDNKGFNVQVSADGKTYRNIGFVASQTPNSTAPKAYTFTDTEKNKAGTRYYRLEQVDLDSKSTFYAPRTVTFEGKAVATGSIVAYPNPLTNEILHLSLNSAVNGTAVVRVLDMTGRQVAQRELNINIGSNDVAVENMSELKSGLYILNISLPSGEKKSMKVVKQ